VAVIVAIGLPGVGMIAQEQSLVVVAAAMAYTASEIARAVVGMEMSAGQSQLVVACVAATVDLVEVVAFVSPSIPSLCL
jgi:hypothetical protein